ncbi:hypothetical protein BN19_039 [Streptococcus phage SP-QS1]|uniref:Uncharacterized protein n=1 Tax=Streptococcus phage SP-QS1 TaxID=1208587 RepID=S6CQM7_9CAUD|nr:hypothetical protein BN19_039 [Streptococcus phage SP-QS1]CCJ09692.1 hypothetical protein BN19_039 [Streptococcus phage SP-QS1]
MNQNCLEENSGGYKVKINFRKRLDKASFLCYLKGVVRRC